MGIHTYNSLCVHMVNPRYMACVLGHLNQDSQRRKFEEKIFNDVTACLNQPIAALIISWSSCCTCSDVQSAVWGCPYHIKVARFESIFVIPFCDICDNLRFESSVPIYIGNTPSRLTKRLPHWSRTRTKEQRFWHVLQMLRLLSRDACHNSTHVFVTVRGGVYAPLCM